MLPASEIDLQWKVVLLGSASTGKTSILRRLIFGAFPEDVTSTLGAALSTYDVKVNDTIVHLNVWDTAGQESYRSLARLYYRDAKAAVVVFDVTSSASFNEVEFWIGELDQAESFSHYIILVGNKIDQEEDRVVSRADAESLAERSGAIYMETSALTGEGVTNVFKTIAEHFMTVAETNRNAKNTKLTPKREENSCC